jgi:hypothetical protein
VKARDQAGAEDPSPATRAFTVNYTPSLTVQGEGNGTGWVVSNPSGISCSIDGTTETGDCSEIYASGTQVMLTADPTGGSKFAGWSGGGCSEANPCTVTMNQSNTVTATFIEPSPPEIFNISASFEGVSTTCKYPSGVTFTGNLYSVRFYYDDSDGDVIKGQGATKVLNGTTDVTMWSSFSGDGFNGSIGYYPCYELPMDYTPTVNMSLIDAMGHPSNSLSIKLPPPP